MVLTSPENPPPVEELSERASIHCSIDSVDCELMSPENTAGIGRTFRKSSTNPKVRMRVS